MTLADRIRSERRAQGLTQGALASACGVGKIAQGNYENGHRVPRADYLCALSGLGFDVHYILSGVRSPLGEAHLCEAEGAFIRRLRLLDKEDREAIQRVLATLTKSAE